MIPTVLASTAAWALLCALLRRLPHPMNQREEQTRNEFDTIYYVTISVATLATLPSFSLVPSALYSLMTPTQVQVVCVMLGYLLFSTILTALTRPNLSILIHHLVAMSVFSLALVWGYHYQFLMWVMVQQVTGVVFHPLMLIRMHPGYRTRYRLPLELLHLAVFAVARMLLLPYLSVVVVLHELRATDHLLAWRVIALVGLLLANLLNSYWFIESLKRVRRLLRAPAPLRASRR